MSSPSPAVEAVGTFMAGAGVLLLLSIIVLVFAALLRMTLMFLKALLSDPNDGNVMIELRYPVVHPKVRPLKEVYANVPARDDSFFNDASGVDLEYRGVGIVEDRVGAAVVGKTLSA